MAPPQLTVDVSCAKADREELELCQVGGDGSAIFGQFRPAKAGARSDKGKGRSEREREGGRVRKRERGSEREREKRGTSSAQWPSGELGDTLLGESSGARADDGAK